MPRSTGATVRRTTAEHGRRVNVEGRRPLLLDPGDPDWLADAEQHRWGRLLLFEEP